MVFLERESGYVRAARRCNVLLSTDVCTNNQQWCELERENSG
jgi:hypothetical protein